jgi:hypothetical protein
VGFLEGGERLMASKATGDKRSKSVVPQAVVLIVVAVCVSVGWGSTRDIKTNDIRKPRDRDADNTIFLKSK